MANILINTDTLTEWITRGQPLVILDARARLADAGAGKRLFEEGHIPGAMHADMDTELSDPPSPEGGRHPLPDKRAFAARLRGWGITPDHKVVVYDDHGARLAAARTWWMLQWAGHPATHVLDGGWPAWQAANQPAKTGTARIKTSDWQPQFDDSLIATTADVAAGKTPLLDARPAARFRGEGDAVDAASGHIPGASNIPAGSLLRDDQSFKSTDEINAQLPDTHDAIAYCGSGISACQVILAHAMVERPIPRLYPGSWSAWSADPDRPVATGDE